MIAIVEQNTDLGKEKFPEQRIVASVEEVLDEIDAAIIVTPTSTHYQITKTLLKNGKHVFCEKPMTSTFVQAKEIQELVESRNLLFQVGHSERFHKVWDECQKYNQFLEGNSIVRINRVAAFKGRATDVDVVQDLMIHDIDLLFYLFKDKPVSVRSLGKKIRTDKWDHVTSIFKYSNGREAHVTVGRNHVKEIRDLEIINNDGCLYVDLFSAKYSVSLKDEDNLKEEAYPKRDHLLLEQEHFYNSILNSSPAIIDIDAGVHAVEIIEKVLESLESGGEVSI